MGLFSQKIKSYSTLSPEQEQLMRTVGPQLKDFASGGIKGATYQGPLSSGISSDEQQNIDSAARFGAVAGKSLTDLATYDDSKFNDQFQSEIADPTYRDFKTNVAPYLEESLPTFSTARTNVLARELGNTSDRLLQQRFAAREDAKNRAINAASAGAVFHQTQAGTLAVPREVAQAGLDREFANFYAGNQNYQAGINGMLNFLGIQTKGFVNEGSTFDHVLAAINTAANVMSSTQGGGGGAPGGGGGGQISGAGGGASIGNNSRAGAMSGWNKAFDSGKFGYMGM